MAKGKEIIWAPFALEEKRHILTFWTLHNGSQAFSIKLNREIEDAVDFLAKHPHTGLLTNENVRRVLVREYIIFYEVSDEQILIVSIWDGRQDPEKLINRLE